MSEQKRPDEAELRKVVNRLKRARGQLTAVIDAMETDADCRDVIIQLAAVGKAIDRAGFAVISSALQTCLANLGLVDFAQADGHGLGLQGFDHGDLRRCLVDACGLAGDLDHHGIAYGLAYHALGLAVALHIEAMVAPRIADVHVQHRGSCVQAGLGRGGQRGWRDGYGRVVGGLFVGTVGRHGHDQWVNPLVGGGG